ncbi:MAG: TrkA C-terminal domain-containing protein, partial [Bacteriovoracia bacterium]
AIENTFLTNLNEKEREELARKSVQPELAPWQASLSEFVLSPHSPLVAKSLQDSQLKESFGVTIAMIQRGNRRLLAPGRSDLLLPFDRIFLIGSDEQLSQAQVLIEASPSETEAPLPSSFGLEQMKLGPGSPYIGRSIRDSGLRDHAMGLIVGLEREGQRLLSPDSALTLLEGDHLWIVGDKSLIAEIKKTPRS